MIEKREQVEFSNDFVEATFCKHQNTKRTHQKHLLLLVVLVFLSCFIFLAIIGTFMGIQKCSKQSESATLTWKQLLHSYKAEDMRKDVLMHWSQRNNDDQEEIDLTNNSDIRDNHRNRRAAHPTRKQLKSMGMNCVNNCGHTVCACGIAMFEIPLCNCHFYPHTGTCCGKVSSDYCNNWYEFKEPTPRQKCKNSTYSIEEYTTTPAHTTAWTAVSDTTQDDSTLVSDTSDTSPSDTPPSDTIPIGTTPSETPPSDTPPSDTPSVDTSSVDTPLSDTQPFGTPPFDTRSSNTPPVWNTMEGTTIITDTMPTPLFSTEANTSPSP